MICPSSICGWCLSDTPAIVQDKAHRRPDVLTSGQRNRNEKKCFVKVYYICIICKGKIISNSHVGVSIFSKPSMCKKATTPPKFVRTPAKLQHQRRHKAHQSVGAPGGLIPFLLNTSIDIQVLKKIVLQIANWLYVYRSLRNMIVM